MSQPDKNASPDRLEGTLLKQGGKGLKAWRKRVFKADGAKPFLYHYEPPGKHLKGVVDLTSVVSVQSIEGRVSIRGDTQKYFPFELVRSSVPGVEPKNVRLAAATREELEYWMKGIESILKKLGTQLEQNMSRVVMEDVSKLKIAGMAPELCPGEKLVNFVPFIRVDDSPTVVNLFLTNYKLHLKEPKPTKPTNDDPPHYLPDSHLKGANYSITLASIYRAERVEAKEALVLDLYTRTGRKIRLKFPTSSTGDDPRDSVMYHLSLYTPEKIENLFAFAYKLEAEAEAFVPTENRNFYEHGYYYYNAEEEFKRMNVPNKNWRITEVNKCYELIPSYPHIFAVPATINDPCLTKISSFRTRGRIPALSWMHPTIGTTITRSSQPRRGVRGLSNTKDELLLETLAQGGNGNILHVVDCRAFAAAQANRTIGGGFEDGYKNCKVSFYDIDNIHAVRASWKGLSALCEPAWLMYLFRILHATSRVVHWILAGDSILVHCSDGWDRTSQVTALSMLLLDPYYRTFEGFQLLIEKEWLSFGHQFALRNGISTEVNKTSSEESPIFCQFLECVRHLMDLYPNAFEFNEDLLISIYDNLYSCCFGTFLFNCERERKENRIMSSTCSFWRYVANHKRYYLNPWYKPINREIIPKIEFSSLRVWNRLWYRWDPFWREKMLEKEAKTRDLLAEFLKLGGKIEQLSFMKPILERSLKVYTFAEDSTDKRMTNNDLSSSQRFGDSENTSEFTDLESEKLLEKIRENSKFFNNGNLPADGNGDLSEYAELAELADFGQHLEKVGVKVPKKARLEAESARSAESVSDEEGGEEGILSLKSVYSLRKTRSKLRVHSTLNKASDEADEGSSQPTSPKKKPILSSSQSAFELRNPSIKKEKDRRTTSDLEFSPRPLTPTITTTVVSEEVRRRVPASILACVGPPPNESLPTPQ